MYAGPGSSRPARFLSNEVCNLGYHTCSFGETIFPFNINLLFFSTVFDPVIKSGDAHCNLLQICNSIFNLFEKTNRNFKFYK